MGQQAQTPDEQGNAQDTTPTGGGDTGQPVTPAGQNQGDGGAPPAEGERTFTQADVDRIVAERARRAGRGAVTDFLERLGVKDQGELETLVKAQREAEEAEKSEIQKAQDRIARLEREKAEAEALARERAIQAEVTAVATTLEFRNPADAYALANLAGVEIGEDGQVSGVKEALEALLKERPYLKADKKAAPDIDGQRGTGSGEGQLPAVQHLLPPALRGAQNQQQQQ